jgi:hypothetical protein
MKNKIDKIDIRQNGVMFEGEYHFLNSDDFDKLCDRLLCKDPDWNIIKIGSDVFIKFDGDLSDLGNDIGLNIGDYIDDKKFGYEKDDLISGINHGISIIDGSHG